MRLYFVGSVCYFFWVEDVREDCGEDSFLSSVAYREKIRIQNAKLSDGMLTTICFSVPIGVPHLPRRRAHRQDLRIN